MGKMALLLLSTTPAFSASTPIEAGRWSINNQMEEALFDGERDPAPFPPSKPQSVCLSAINAAKGPGLAFSDTGMCRILTSTLSAGTFAFSTECKATESHDVIITKTYGRYAKDSYSGQSTSIQQRDGMRIEMRSRIEAKRIGDC